MINYWHIQLHSDRKLEGEILRKILTQKQVIGMRKTWNNKAGNPVKDPQLFGEVMKVGDVVLIRNGSKPVALVSVTSDAYLETKVDEKLDWFEWRRQIKVLGFYSEKEEQFLQQILQDYGNKHIQALGTLTFCKGNTATNDFIREWHRRSGK